MRPTTFLPALMLLCGALARGEELQRFETTQRQMGIAFHVVVYAPGEDVANTAVTAAFARIKQLNGILSDYEPDSELMRLCARAGQVEPVPVSDELWHVLREADWLSRASDGAFDISIGPLVKLWRQARRTKLLPNGEDLEAARKLVDYRQIEFAADRQAVRLKTRGMRLDAGGIGVGYAVDEALAVLKAHGVTRALIDGSGDIAVGDPPPDAPGWRIGIAPLDAPDGEPSRHVVLKNAGISTSGDAFQFVEIDGRRYSHIVDPHTGLGLSTRSSVTVIAPNGLLADALATTVCVLGPQEGLKLIESKKGAAVLIAQRVGEKIEVHESKRLPDFLESEQAPSAPR